MNTLFDTFQSFRTIYCVCPCCNKLMRLSDLRLQYEGEAPETWLDKYEKKEVSLREKEEKFKNKEKDMRKKAAEKGTVLGTVFDAIKRSKKGVAIEKIKEKSGFDGRQLSNALYKLTKQGKIKTVSRGVYIKK